MTEMWAHIVMVGVSCCQEHLYTTC